MGSLCNWVRVGPEHENSFDPSKMAAVLRATSLWQLKNFRCFPVFSILPSILLTEKVIHYHSLLMEVLIWPNSVVFCNGIVRLLFEGGFPLYRAKTGWIHCSKPNPDDSPKVFKK